MPCEYYLPGEGEAATRRDLDKLTRRVCAHCRALESAGLGSHIKGELKVWWEFHKKRDAVAARRNAYEAEKGKLKKAALAKLSAEERKALGI